MRVLVNGLLPYESGKTWFVISLANALKLKGYKIAIYKPVAGHSAWYQFNTVEYSIKYGLLIGEDVYKYRKFVGINLDFNLINPIDLLLAPPDPVKYNSVSDYIVALNDQFKQVIMFRISLYDYDLEPIHYMIKDNINNVIDGLKPYIEKLINTLKPYETDINTMIRMIFSKKCADTIVRCLKELMNDHDIVLIESFNDAATPSISILDYITHVITVAPGRLYILDRDDFKRKTIEQYYKMGDVGIRMSNIIDRVKIRTSICLPAFSNFHNGTRCIGSTLENIFQ